MSDIRKKPEKKQIVEEALPQTPHRCVGCNRLLFKGAVGLDGTVSVKCGRCHTMNVFKANIQTPENFQDKIIANKIHNGSIIVKD